MTTKVTLNGLFCLTKVQTCGSEPCHNFDPSRPGFGPPESLERKFLTETGERGVVGVVGVLGVVDSLGASSDATDSGGGDGLWRVCLIASLGISISASRSSTPMRAERKSLRLPGIDSLRTCSG
jgi:hypothetical protein